MKQFLIFILLVLSSNVAFAEKCPLNQLEEFEYLDIHCQFYLGTQGFRNKQYSVAAAHWKEIKEQTIEYDGEKELKAMAISNLGFLVYNGYGVEESKEYAISLWKEAVDLDDLEARRHLGFAFSDENYSSFDLVIALGWYESIFMILGNESALSEDNKPIYEHAKSSANELKPLLELKEQKKAKKFAKSTINI